MVIKNYDSNYFWSIIVDSIDVFDCAYKVWFCCMLHDVTVDIFLEMLLLEIQYNTNLLAYQQNTMPLAIYNTKQYDIHLLSLLYKTTSTGGCRDKRHHSIRHQYIYACSNAYLLETGWVKLRCLRRLCNRTCQVRIT